MTVYVANDEIYLDQTAQTPLLKEETYMETQDYETEEEPVQGLW